MNLTNEEKYRLLEDMSKDESLKRQIPPARLSWLFSYTIVIFILAMVSTLAISECNPKYDNMSFTQLPWYLATLTAITLMSGLCILIEILIGFFFDDTITGMYSQKYEIKLPPIIANRQDLKTINKKIVNNEYETLTSHTKYEYDFLDECASLKTVKKAKEIIESSSKLHLLKNTFNDKNLVKHVEDDDLFKARDKYLQELTKLDNELLNLLTPEIEAKMLKLAQDGNTSYLLDRMQKELATKKLQNILKEVDD